MTRPEITGNREHDLYFSKWIRSKLPDSYTGYRCHDIDFVLWHKETKQIMLIELKSNNSYCKPDQRLILKLLHNWIGAGIDSDWTYLGLHLVVFENTCFEDGRCFFDNVEVTESELIEKLNLCPSLVDLLEG